MLSQNSKNLLLRYISCMYSVPNIHIGNYGYYDNNLFRWFLKINFHSNIIEIPVFLRYAVEEYIFSNLDYFRDNGSFNDAVFAISNPCGSYTVKTANSLLSYLITGCNGREPIKVITKKDEEYYGYKGIFFDKNMRILYMNVFEAKLEGPALTYDKLVTYVHPSVFTSNGTLEKEIVKRIIPLLITEVNRMVNGNYVNIVVPDSLKSIVKIEDATDKFMCTPNSPDTSEFLLLNMEAKNLLLHNINEINEAMNQ